MLILLKILIAPRAEPYRRSGKVGETVLVIDDVMTTGSTLSECARVLKEAGAGKVWCATLARSLRT